MKEEDRSSYVCGYDGKWMDDMNVILNRLNDINSH